MITRIENKFIDKSSVITIARIMSLFNCNLSEGCEILNNYLKQRTTINTHLNIISRNNLIDLGNVKRINGNLNIVNSDIQNLGQLSVVIGDVAISNTLITNTGKLKYCESLYINSDNFTEIKSHLTEIIGNLTLYQTSIKNLNNIRLVGGNVNLIDNNNLTSLGKLEKVFKDIKIVNCNNLVSLDNLSTVEGNLDIRKADLISFGDLIDLRGFMIVLKSKVLVSQSNLEILDLGLLKNSFPNLPNCQLVKVPKIDNLRDINMIIINDDDVNTKIF